MSASSLAWRSDLLVSPHQATEDRAFVIKDPVTGRFFRLREIEHFIARQLDGTISLEELQCRLEEKFASTVSTETLERFIERLRGLGLVVDTRNAAAPVARPSGTVRGNLFYLRFKAFDPDRLFDWLITKVRCLMTPGFVTLSAAMIALAFVVTFCNWPQISREFMGLW
ncbi:MAG TPA: PqqD family protein, partial [Verrucomicrobiae bacterium]|nr:PqqD family protein [Verrucomicrobiae bacterium]